MLQKIFTLLWFTRRPSHWAYAVDLLHRKLRVDRDTEDDCARATAWSESRAVSVDQALIKLGLIRDAEELETLPEELLREGNELARKSSVVMGGPGDLELLFGAVRASKSERIVETGVAYGWSSLAILAAIKNCRSARLVSVDMAYPKLNNEAFVGVVVPERLRGNWTKLALPDRTGLKKAIRLLGEQVDLIHYDSDKSWYGRKYAHDVIWPALRPGGVFISDDIQDNLAFAEFVDRMRLTYAVTKSGGKFTGIVVKPKEVATQKSAGTSK